MSEYLQISQMLFPNLLNSCLVTCAEVVIDKGIKCRVVTFQLFVSKFCCFSCAGFRHFGTRSNLNQTFTHYCTYTVRCGAQYLPLGGCPLKTLKRKPVGCGAGLLLWKLDGKENGSIAKLSSADGHFKLFFQIVT